MFEVPTEEEDSKVCTEEVLVDVGKATGRGMGVSSLRSPKDRQSSDSCKAERYNEYSTNPVMTTPSAPQNMMGKHIIVFSNDNGLPQDPFDKTRDASFLTNETSFLTNETSFYTHNPEDVPFLETESTYTDDWIVEKETRDGGADVLLSLLFCHAI